MYPHRINLREPWQAIATPEGIAYRRVFKWPTELMPFEQLWLIIGGVDSPYQVKINQQFLGSQGDGRVPFERDISSLIQNQNLIEIECVPGPEQSFRGITRTVFLEVRRSVHLEHLVGRVLWQDERPRLQLRAKLSRASERRLSIVVRLNDHEVHYEELPLDASLIEVIAPPLEAPHWQPGRENVLHQLEVHLLDPACVLAQHTFATGFSQHRSDEPAVALPVDEPIFESPLLEQADRMGQVVVSNHHWDTLPWLWYHPCLKWASPSGQSM